MMATEKNWDVLGLGAVAVDDLLFVDQFPRPDGKTPVRARLRNGGGLAGTALVAAARLGQRAAYCGVLGDDELSRFTLEELQREGVDCSLVARRSEARPYHSVVLVPTDGRRSILYSSQGVQPPDETDLPEMDIAAARVLFVDHTVAPAAVRAAAIARQHGIPVVADVEQAVFPEREAFLAVVDHLIINREIACALSGTDVIQAALIALLANRTAVVITDGEAGCWYAAQDRIIRHHPALAVEVKDTTGCGDVFHGAYAACLSWGGTLEDAVCTATLAAGLKAAQPGGRAGIPTRRQIEEFQMHPESNS